MRIPSLVWTDARLKLMEEMPNLPLHRILLQLRKAAVARAGGRASMARKIDFGSRML